MQFSIVIPVLNGMPYLERAVRSVLAQAEAGTEIIVVDGGSRDGTVEWLEQHHEWRRIADYRNQGSGCDGVVKKGASSCALSQPPSGGDERVKAGCGGDGAPPSRGAARVRLGTASLSRDGAEAPDGLPPEGGTPAGDAAARACRPPEASQLTAHNLQLTKENGVSVRWMSGRDGGQSEALNKGFAVARGEYLLWLNGDDLLWPGALRALRQVIEQRRPEWLAGNMVVIDKDDRVVKCRRGASWSDYVYRHAPVRVYGPGAVFTRELFERVGGFDESLHYCMDSDLWLRFKAAGARYYRMGEYLWGFREHAGSKTMSGLGNTEVVQAEERVRMYRKNGLEIRRWHVMVGRLRRLVGGAYLRGVWDYYRNQGTGCDDGIKKGASACASAGALLQPRDWLR